ncbi:hypothetical protein BFW01_g6533 [Lasiodiplodia theobromae]|nr:hypothetical protein BFW01_g6533 [Lasiodiplodia theobromae]
MAEPDPEAIHIPVVSPPPFYACPTNMLHAQSADDSNDSAFGDDISDTTSVASTIWRHRYENGRRYHKFREGAYW